MKTNEYVKDLNTKSVDELTQALVEAKKELLNNLAEKGDYCRGRKKS